MTLKTKIFISVAVLILLVSAGLIFYSVNQSSDILLNEEEEQGRIRLSFIQDEMEDQIDAARLNTQTLANNRELQRLFAERDRDGLLEVIEPAFNANQEEIPRIHFHEEDSTSFLRVHNPDNYGDDLSGFREIVNEVNERQVMLTGLEEGGSGYGFRVVVPISYEGEHVGSMEASSSFGQSFIEGIQESVGGEIFIYTFERDDSAAWEASDNGLLSGTAEDRWPVADEALANLESGEEVITLSDDESHLLSLLPYQDYTGEIRGYIKSVQNREAVIAQAASIQRNSILIAILGAGLSAIIIFFLLNILLKPIGVMADFTQEVAKGDLTQKLKINSKGELGTLKDSINSMIEQLRNIISEINENSDSMVQAAGELSIVSDETGQSAEEIARSITAVAEGSEEISREVSGIEEITNELDTRSNNLEKNVENSLSTARETMEAANSGEESVQKAISQLGVVTETVDFAMDAIENLEDRSGQIGEMVQLIEGIASQTNLLALNAAIEAARAGEHGSGFAVVAEEVRQLAEESADAAGKITSLIEDIQSETKATINSMDTNKSEVEKQVAMIQRAGKSLQEMVKTSQITENNVQEVQKFVLGLEEQIKEVNSYIDSIAGAVENNAASSEEVSALAEEQSATVEEVAASSDELENIASHLKGLIDQFKIKED